MASDNHENHSQIVEMRHKRLKMQHSLRDRSDRGLHEEEGEEDTRAIGERREGIIYCR